MTDPLLDAFATFYEELPQSVRYDLAFMIVVLSNENVLVVDAGAIDENDVRSLFAAETRLGRLGNLINAVSMFDVYFEMDAGARFEERASPRHNGRIYQSPINRYADRVAAFRRSARRWRELRRTVFTPQAIAAALIPPDNSSRRRRKSAQPVTSSVEASGHAVP